MKKPFPSMARSRASPVAVRAPEVMSRWGPAIWTPRPIWRGLEPPSLGLGTEPMLKVRLKALEKIIRLDLNAVVFALAMLLPITSRARALALRPESPVKSAVVEAMSKPRVVLWDQ